jgi:hypothetical protein
LTRQEVANEELNREVVKATGRLGFWAVMLCARWKWGHYVFYAGLILLMLFAGVLIVVHNIQAVFTGDEPPRKPLQIYSC